MPPGEMMKKKIFISHSSKDIKFIRALKKHLDQHFTAWISSDDLRPAKDISEKISSKLSECDYIIFILTKNALHSSYVNQEIGFALAANKNVLPIINYKNKLPGFLLGRDAIQLIENSPKKTYIKIFPYLDNSLLYKNPPLRESKNAIKLRLTGAGLIMWKSVLNEMEKGPTPISSFCGSYESYENRSQQDKLMIDKRIEDFNNFFLKTGIVEALKLEEYKNQVYSFFDLNNWQKHTKQPVIYKLTKHGKDFLERIAKADIGDTLEISIESRD